MAGRIDERWMRAQRGPRDRSRRTIWTRLNPQVSVYWLWLVLVFGSTAAMPLLPISEKLTHRTRYLPLATAYFERDLSDYWQAILVAHTVGTLLVAASAAVLHTVIRRRLGKRERVDFSLRQMLLGTGVLALFLGLLAWHRAPPVVFCAAILLYSGWPATLILVGIVCRERVAEGTDGGSRRLPDAE